MHFHTPTHAAFPFPCSLRPCKFSLSSSFQVGRKLIDFPSLSSESKDEEKKGSRKLILRLEVCPDPIAKETTLIGLRGRGEGKQFNDCLSLLFLLVIITARLIDRSSPSGQNNWVRHCTGKYKRTDTYINIYLSLAQHTHNTLLRHSTFAPFLPLSLALSYSWFIFNTVCRTTCISRII